MAGVEILDQFTETLNTALVLHVPQPTPTVGGSWTELEKTGTPAGQVLASSDRARADGAGNNVSLIDVVNPAPTLADYDVEVTVGAKPASGTTHAAGVVARAADASNYYGLVLYHSAAAQHFRLFKKVAASVTSLAADTTNAVTAGDVFKLELRGTAIKVYQNGTERMSVTDSALSAAGKAGLCWGSVYDAGDDISTAWEFDNFTVTTVETAAGHPAMRRGGRIPIGLSGVRIY